MVQGDNSALENILDDLTRLNNNTQDQYDRLSDVNAFNQSSSGLIITPRLRYLAFLDDDNGHSSGGDTRIQTDDVTWQGTVWLPTWAWLLLGGSFLVIVAIIALLLVLLNRSKPPNCCCHGKHDHHTCHPPRVPCMEYLRYREGLINEMTNTVRHLHPHRMRHGWRRFIDESDSASQNDVTPEHRNDQSRDGNYTANIIKFAQQVTWEGGVIGHHTSDVTVTVPAGAFSARTIDESLQVDVSVSLGSCFISDAQRHRDVQLTPVVRMRAPTLNLFHQPITIRLPHRADIKPTSTACDEWHMSYCRQWPASVDDWQTATYSYSPLDGVDVTFSYDEHYVYAQTSMTSCVMVCLGQTTTSHGDLRLAAAVETNESLPERCTTYRVHITPPWRDSYEILRREEEERYGNVTCTTLTPLSVTAGLMTDWQITLSSRRDTESCEQDVAQTDLHNTSKTVSMDTVDKWPMTGSSHTVEFTSNDFMCDPNSMDGVICRIEQLEDSQMQPSPTPKQITIKPIGARQCDTNNRQYSFLL